ncbi:hypothetical protein DPM33_28245 [Mesorhizobium hawassense]|uniref:Uncharacterized protein n=1 Tax=Mesorhizobium hawassense TaxID=1209954 RepID=A0A330HGC3_9HYPH|nr:hypothetical protein DPM33_28245 [Mesorhizobium hawassense]
MHALDACVAGPEFEMFHLPPARSVSGALEESGRPVGLEAAAVEEYLLPLFINAACFSRGGWLSMSLPSLSNRTQ